VRGITKPSFKRFIETDGYFKVQKIRGGNFCHLPTRINAFFAYLFPTLSTSLFFEIGRTDKKGVFIEVLKTRVFETAYYKGDTNKVNVQ
jgi:hypothetical protein